MPEAGARVGVMPRAGGNADITWVSIDPVYVFHVVNCYDTATRWSWMSSATTAIFDTGPGEAIASTLPVLARWTVDVAANRVTEQRLDDVAVEFPRIDDTVAGLPHRYGYCTRSGDRPEEPLRGTPEVRPGARRVDPFRPRTDTGRRVSRCSSGRPTATGEDEGWILSVVHDATRDTSDLVILDATSFAGPPVATVHLPARVPFGFHGSWVPADS